MTLLTSYRRLIGFSLLCISSAAFAQAPISDTNGDIEDIQSEKNKPHGDFWKYQELDEDLHGDPVSESFEYVLNTSHRFANWVDGFFDDDRTKGIKNTTRIKLSAWGFFDKDDSYDDSDFNFNIRVKLPRTQKRVQFIITNDPDEDLSTSRAGGVFPDQQKSDETTVGFRFFDLAGLSKKIPGKFSTAIGVGFSSYDPTFKIEPRYIYTHDFDIWSMTFLQKVRWHSEKGWRAETRFDFDRALSKKYFFRFNNEMLWEEDQEDFDGYEYRPRLILSRRYSSKQALLYEWNNLFRSEPSFDLFSSALAVRYRRQFWRPWLFVEVAPQVAFREEEDWDASPGVFAKLEILMKKTDK
ncbi:MAG: hypothetical protein QNL05_11085 [Gammaproteobacteria bacterium]|nr:hypothetical protein [Gammaproteobacteria bacterium]MDX2488102.1 hypothetical protein [Gammaproteobacteria bacterium]